MYSLEETWLNCIKMWTWIVDQTKDMSKSYLLNNDTIDDLKEQWIDEHGQLDTSSGCFFCDYDTARGQDTQGREASRNATQANGG